MSQIFDALLRSETERAGNNPIVQAEATELLRHVESQTAANRACVALLDRHDPENDGAGNMPFDKETAPAAADTFDQSATAQRPSYDERSNALNQFQSLSATISPNSRLVSLTDKESAPAEAFRLLGVRLRDLRQTRPLKKVLITSSTPQEGKSTMAANLACALSHNSGERVLLVEGDLRKPSLAQMFELGHAPGICEWLQGANDLRASVYHLKEADLWILPAGRGPADPLRLLQSARLPLLMDELSKTFDWIIVDSPPILPLADTSVWTRMIDGILFVTRRGITEKKQLVAGVNALDSRKLIGALLNCSKSTVYSNYYYKSSSVA